MKNRFFEFIFHKVMGWHEHITITLPEKCIIAIAPHTSNWDFIVGEMFIHYYGWRSGFMMKKDWFFWPMGPILKKMGGVPIDRNKKGSTVEQTIEIAKAAKRFHLGITPEGTRKPNPNWKHGFYYIAVGANIPIIPIAIDYRTKAIIAEQIWQPTDNADEGMKKLKQYFAQFQGKHPENFKI